MRTFIELIYSLYHIHQFQKPITRQRNEKMSTSMQSINLK